MLLLDDLTGTNADGHLQSLAHGVVTMEKLVPLYGAQRRRLRVAKLRGVDFRGGYHDFVIERGGVVVFPRLVASEHKHDFERGVASSGMPELDAMLGGGLDRGTSALLLGPPGTGKSALATQWASAAAGRGEKVFVYAFDESLATMEARSKSLGIDLPAHEKAGRIVVRQIDPAEVPPGQLTHQIRQAVENDGARMVIIDSLNGYLKAMPDESFLVLQLHELLTYLGRQGVVSILVVAQHGLVGASMVSPTDVTYLADTVLLLRHFEAGGTLRKAVSVLKKRTGKHESAIRELRLSDKGITAGEPLTKFRGVLTGVPTYEGSADALLAAGPVAEMAESSVRENELLVFAPSGRDAVLATQVLEQGGMTARICGSADELVAAIGEGAGGALVAQEALSLPVIAALAGSAAQPAALVGLSAHHLHAADGVRVREPKGAGGVRRSRQRDRAREADPSADDGERRARGAPGAHPPVRGARRAGTAGARRQAARSIPGPARSRAAQSPGRVAKRVQAAGARCGQPSAAREPARHHRSAD